MRKCIWFQMFVFGGVPLCVRKASTYQVSFHMAKLSTSYFCHNDRIGYLELFWVGFFFCLQQFRGEQHNGRHGNRSCWSSETLLRVKSKLSWVYKFQSCDSFVQWYNWTDGILLSPLFKVVALLFRDKEGRELNIAFFSPWVLLAKIEKYWKLFASSKRH